MNNFKKVVIDGHFGSRLFLYLGSKVSGFAQGVVLFPNFWMKPVVIVCVQVVMAHNPLFEILVG